MSVLCVFNKTRDSFLALRLIRAIDVFERPPQLSLIGEQHDAVWVESARAIHTPGRTAPMDVAYLDASCRVIRLVEHLESLPLVALPPACHSLLELPARTIFGSHTQTGDQLVICTPEDFGRSVGPDAIAA
jgi:hypothetical protein